MSYNRKQYDKIKLKKISEETLNSWPAGSDYDEDKGCYVRLYKSKRKTSVYAVYKKVARQKSRLYAKQNNVYTKKAYDLWWNVF